MPRTQRSEEEMLAHFDQPYTVVEVESPTGIAPDYWKVVDGDDGKAIDARSDLTGALGSAAMLTDARLRAKVEWKDDYYQNEAGPMEEIAIGPRDDARIKVDLDLSYEEALSLIGTLMEGAQSAGAFLRGNPEGSTNAYGRPYALLALNVANTTLAAVRKQIESLEHAGEEV